MWSFGKKKVNQAGDALPEGVKRVFAAMARDAEGKKLADKGVSYREIGKYDKAIKCLLEALQEYHYSPAISLIGNTIRKSGDNDGAIVWFRDCLRNAKERRYPLTELYANLGSIYLNSKSDPVFAAKLFKYGLSEDDSNVCDEQTIALMRSMVFHDLAICYVTTGDLYLALESAREHLKLFPSCESCIRLEELHETIIEGHMKWVHQRLPWPIQIRDGRGSSLAVLGIEGGQVSVIDANNRNLVSMAVNIAIRGLLEKLPRFDIGVFCRSFDVELAAWNEKEFSTYVSMFFSWFCSSNTTLTVHLEPIRNEISKTDLCFETGFDLPVEACDAFGRLLSLRKDVADVLEKLS